MPEASPAKWHLAHTTWFFETFLLRADIADYRPFHAGFGYLFNSYYNALGDRLSRDRRGLLTRPTVDEIYRYRKHVDDHMRTLLFEMDGQAAQMASLLELGLNHEQQHQELLLTDLLHAFAQNPLRPAYRILPAVAPLPEAGVTVPCRWLDYAEGLRFIGHDGQVFVFDNETPRHRVFMDAFRLASRLATNDEYAAFMADKGYERPELWLSDGWSARQTHGWQAPLYWEKRDGRWERFGPDGVSPLIGRGAGEPCQLLRSRRLRPLGRGSSADRAGMGDRSRGRPDCRQFSRRWAAVALAGAVGNGGGPPAQMFGDVWEWTASPYIAYPGYRPAAGALGEYNGKFMVNQFVLRGGSCFTPRSHMRATLSQLFRTGNALAGRGHTPGARCLKYNHR